MTIELRNAIPSRDALVALYESVGWTIYARDPERLETAVIGSAFVVTAWDGDGLVGLARCISDGATIAYLQDVLVRPERQGAGLGRRLVQACLDHFEDIRQFVLLTDDRPEQLGFYASLGFRNTRDLERTRLNAFVKIRGAELS